MTIAQDERLKGLVHGLLLGCAVPVIAYNVAARRVLNVLVYTAFIGFELWSIGGHWKAIERAGDTPHENH